MHNKQPFFIPQSYSFMVYDIKEKKKKGYFSLEELYESIKQ